MHRLVEASRFSEATSRRRDISGLLPDVSTVALSFLRVLIEPIFGLRFKSNDTFAEITKRVDGGQVPRQTEKGQQSGKVGQMASEEEGKRRDLLRLVRPRAAFRLVEG